MKKLLIIAAALLLIPAPSFETGFDPRNPAKYHWLESPEADYHDAVVRVSVGVQGGTGFVVATEGDGVFVLTNWHVIERDGKIALNPIITTDIMQFHSQTIYSSEEQDLAVLYAKGIGRLPAIPVASQAPAFGAEAELLGFGGPYPALRHVVGKLNESERYALCVATACVSGDSGGPIVCLSADGKPAVVGQNFGGPTIKGRVQSLRGDYWSMVWPASSKTTCQDMREVLSVLCKERNCRLVAGPDLSKGTARIFGRK